MNIYFSTYKKILNSYSQVPPESGGIIGSKNGIVCEYIHDYSNQSTEIAEYVPNVEFLNKQICFWTKANISFAGIVHSHLSGQETLSSKDLQYIDAILSSNKQLNSFYCPIIIPGVDIFVYKIIREADRFRIHNSYLNLFYNK